MYICDNETDDTDDCTMQYEILDEVLEETTSDVLAVSISMNKISNLY